MKFSLIPIRIILISWLISSIVPQAIAGSGNTHKLTNKSFQVEVSVISGNVIVKITDLIQNVVWADGPYRYELGEMVTGQLREYAGLELPKIERQSGRIRILGLIGGFEIQHDLILSGGNAFLAEEMKITNNRGTRRNVTQFHAAFSKRVVDKENNISGEFKDDHFQAVPFLYRSEYPTNNERHDYTIPQIMEGKGFVFKTSELSWDIPKRQDSRSFISEGWGWRHGKSILGIFSFNQDNMIFSSLSYQDGCLYFGGFVKEGLNLSVMERFEALSSIYLGMNRFYPVSGDYNQVAYQYRSMLDELGCRFPVNYDPPVHWNQLYSMQGGWINRDMTYSRVRVFEEAQKAKDHSCQALYLDPGWDAIGFGSLIWANERLGDCADFVEVIDEFYGLKLSLHTPMPPWASNIPHLMGPSAINSWPATCHRMIKTADRNNQEILSPPKDGPVICMGSKQYQDEAEKRLIKLCEDGVTFLMFDGTWWNGSCDDARHGHPVPYLYEDHIDACVAMARRVHQKFPEVLIEMHDMVNGGHPTRSTPVYYKYGLTGSYDENWGFELWANPLNHIKDKNALALYYYNLACNVPLYLHCNTGYDNENNLGFWWYASTVRHLGIGGDATDSIVTRNHQRNMKLYIQLENFFKRGEFYGINERIHVHVVPEKQECVINIFNLADSVSVTEGSFSLDEIGLNPNRIYKSSNDWIRIEKGRIVVRKEMKPLDADIAIVKLLK